MARTVSGTATLTLSVQDNDSQGTYSSDGDNCTVGYSSTQQYTGTTPGSAKQWSGTISLAGSAQTLDLTALAGLRGTTETFAKVYLMVIVNNTATTGQPLLVGNAASDAFSAFWSSATNVQSVPSKGSRLVFENFDTGWTVDATHKNLKLDPSAASFTATVIIIGS